MGRLLNDLTYAFGKKPREVIQYIDPQGNMTEIPFETLTKQGGKRFEMEIKGNDDSKKWDLIYPPIIDELGRKVYVCPYNALTNLPVDNFENFSDETINTLLNYIEPALAREFDLGVEWERRRQEGKKKPKKGLGIYTMIIIGGIVFTLVIFLMLGAVYFMG